MTKEKKYLDGIQALQAIREGHVVLYHFRPMRSHMDRYYCYRCRLSTDETNQKIWFKFIDSFVWEPCDNPTDFWLKVGARFELCENYEESWQPQIKVVEE